MRLSQPISCTTPRMRSLRLNWGRISRSPSGSKNTAMPLLSPVGLGGVSRPRRTHLSRLQYPARRQETYIEGLFDQHNELQYDAGLDAAWIDVLPRLYTPARYAFHTVQMASHYLVQIVPSSTIRNCATYQAADALRCVSHLAYRAAELKQTYPNSGFGTAERTAWENDPAWQGFRELMEKVLVTYDWARVLSRSIWWQSWPSTRFSCVNWQLPAVGRATACSA